MRGPATATAARCRAARRSRTAPAAAAVTSAAGAPASSASRQAATRTARSRRTPGRVPGRWVEARRDGDADGRRLLEALDEPGAPTQPRPGTGPPRGPPPGGRVPPRDPPRPPRRGRPPTARRRRVGRAVLPAAGASTTGGPATPRPARRHRRTRPARRPTPVQPCTTRPATGSGHMRTARTASRTASAVGPFDVMGRRPPTSPARARAAAATRGRGPLPAASTASAVSTRTTPASSGSGTTTPTADTRRTPSDPRHVDDRVQGPAQLGVHGAPRHPGERRQRLDAGRDLVGAVGVQRAHAALVPGVEGGEELTDLGTADLPDDEPVGPHPQRLADEVDERHRPASLDVG